MVVPIRSPPITVEVGDAANPCRSMGVFDHGWSKAEPVVRLAEAGIEPALEKLVNRRAVAVSAVKVIASIEAEPEGIDLAAGEDLDAGSIRTKSKNVPRVEFDLRAILCGEGAGIVEAVGGVYPAVRSHPKTRTHSVGVFFIAQGAEENFAMVSFSVAGGVGEIPNVGNAPGKAAVFVFRFMPGEHPCRNVEPVGEVDHLVGAAIAISIFKDLDGIPATANTSSEWVAPAIFCGSVRIFDRGRHPYPPPGIVSDVDRFVDLWLGGEELDLEPLRDMECGEFFFGRTWLRTSNQGFIA